jgi:predicted RNA-binding protein with RPS1 domain
MIDNGMAQLMRQFRSEPGAVFVAAPFGTKALSDGSMCNFDAVYRHALAPTIEAVGMTAMRADEIYGPQGVLAAVWQGIQRAEIVIVDFSAKAPNVAAEAMMALLLGKRIVVLTQDPEDIPTDVRGLYRYVRYAVDIESNDRLKTDLARQLEAVRKEPATEMLLVPMPGGGTQPVPVRVTVVTREFVIVESDDRRRGVLSNTDVEYARVITDMSRRFSIGDRLNGAFEIDPEGEMRYTLLAGQTNPWPALVAEHPVGSRMVGTVRSVNHTGAFVHVGHGVNGLIPAGSLSGVELVPGMEVEASITRIEAEQRRVTLRFERMLTSTSPMMTSRMPAVGMRTYGEVVMVSPERDGRGGYLLIEIPGFERPGLLHCSKMSDELRADMNAGEVEPGEEIYVEVVRVDAMQGKINLMEMAEPEEAEPGATAE